jgi:hypothetical protein
MLSDLQKKYLEERGLKRPALELNPAVGSEFPKGSEVTWPARNHRCRGYGVVMDRFYAPPTNRATILTETGALVSVHIKDLEQDERELVQC